MGLSISEGQAAIGWYNKGQQLLAERRVKEALECFHAAHQSGFDANQCAAARWTCWMLAGCFERAWEESDRIAASGASDPHRFWNGESWSGKRVMIRCLHGLGDTIQFIRYVPLLKKTCARIVVQAHPQLTTLLEGVPGVDHVMTWERGEAEPEWDLQMEVNELPRIFRTTIQSLPADIPYIQLPQERVNWAAARFSERQGLRIGICWRSGLWDSSRSIPLKEFVKLATRQNHQFFNLQDNAGTTVSVHQMSMDDFEVRDLAAVMAHLDLVITADTMAAHLAGALGLPVWILLPFCADWRWMLDRQDTPWYPNARLFRQRSRGDWTTVMADVEQELRSY
jgi:hypothetical protein